MPLDDLSQTFSALADPTRRAILARLVSGEATVTELAEPFEMSGPAISKHLKVLEKAGLIAKGRQAQWRPRRIEPDRLAAVDAWLGRLIAHYETPDGVDGRAVEAMAERLTRITAHDRMRLAAFRAKTEQKPGTYCLANGDPLP
jgi:DNA-binding transcriptional ArsR family regulator